MFKVGELVTIVRDPYYMRTSNNKSFYRVESNALKLGDTGKITGESVDGDYLIKLDRNEEPLCINKNCIKKLSTPTPFPPNKNAQELGIDTSRKFVVVDGTGHFEEGDILVAIDHISLPAPMFERIFDGETGVVSWGRLAYAPEETKNPFDPTKTFCIYDFANDEERRKVQDILFSKGLIWLEDNCAKYYEGFRGSCLCSSSYRYGRIVQNSIKEDAHYTATAKEFLEEYGETPEMSEPMKIGQQFHNAVEREWEDKVVLTTTCNPSFSLRANYFVDDSFGQIINKPNKSLITKTMTNIVKFAKDLTLSADEKELRRAGLQDEEGNLTVSAYDLLEDFTAKDAGFKNAVEMSEKYGRGDDGDVLESALEWHTAYTKYADQLLETAKAYNAENKKSSS